MYSKYEIIRNKMDIPTYLSYVKDKVLEPIEDNLVESNLKCLYNQIINFFFCCQLRQSCVIHYSKIKIEIYTPKAL